MKMIDFSIVCWVHSNDVVGCDFSFELTDSAVFKIGAI
jgi:hypothetical protein